MEAIAHSSSDHHEMPTEGRELTGVAVSATLHCLTGCAIGEVLGMAIGTALGFSTLGTIALAVGLAFLFGYALTSLPLLRAGFALSAVIPIALAADTLSITTMEIVDNLVMIVVPGAMESGLGSWLFWGALSFALAIAFVLTVPVNRHLIARGKGHTALHETGVHGGPPTRVVGVAVAVAFLFGSTVLIAEAANGGDGEHGAGAGTNDDPHMEDEMSMSTSGQHASHTARADSVRGLGASQDGLALELQQSTLPRNRPSRLRFEIVDAGGEPVRDFDVEHTKQMHLIVTRTDMVGFQHLHPRIDESGAWSSRIEVRESGTYRVFADFNHEGRSFTLAGEVEVEGSAEPRDLAPPADRVRATGGYEVKMSGGTSRAGKPSEIGFTVTRDGKPTDVEPYLGADGHLVALREGDLAFLHTHPEEHSGHESDAQITFTTEFPSPARYGLFLQFRHEGEVRTATFTRVVGR